MALCPHKDEKDKMHAGFFNQTAATKYSMIDIKVNVCCCPALFNTVASKCIQQDGVTRVPGLMATVLVFGVLDRTGNRRDTVVETHTKRPHARFQLESLLRTLPHVRDLP